MTPLDEDKLRAIWQEHALSSKQLTPELLRSRATKFERGVRRRYLRDQASFLLTALLVTVCGMVVDGVLVKVGSLLLVGWCVYSMWGLRRFGAALAPDADPAINACAVHHQRQLERQRAIVLSWPLGIGLGLPGFVLLSLGLGLGARYPNWEIPAALIGIFVFTYIALVIAGRIQAARWQREIDAVRALRGD